MKRYVLGVVCGLVLTVAVSGIAGESGVVSANAVGYVTVTMEPGDLAILRNDFHDLDGEDPTVSKVFGDALPLGTRVYVWDAAAQSYTISRYEETEVAPGVFETGWSENMWLDQGRGFWVQMPGDAAETEVTFMGEVPTEGDVETGILEGLNMVAYPYPVGTLWTDTDLAKKAELGDRVYVWNIETQSYTIARYEETEVAPGVFETKWSTDVEIPAGAGMWFQSEVVDDQRAWQELKPYEWPGLPAD